MDITSLIYDIPIFILLIIAVYTDLAYKKIYNWSTFPAIGIGLILHYFIDGASGFTNSIIGAIIGSGVFFVLYLLGGMGGGDVKLIGAIGALGGPMFVLCVIFYSALIGGLMAVVYLIWRGKLWNSLKKTLLFIFTLFDSTRRNSYLSSSDNKEEIPYGVAIAAGAFLVLMRKYLLH